MPLNDESWAVVLIWSRMLLYCVTRLARISWADGSLTGAPPVRPLKALPEAAEVPPMVPIVDDAASLVVVIVIAPADEIDACRLLAASAVLRSFNDLTVPLVPSPKVIE